MSIGDMFIETSLILTILTVLCDGLRFVRIGLPGLAWIGDHLGCRLLFPSASGDIFKLDQSI